MATPVLPWCLAQILGMAFLVSFSFAGFGDIVCDQCMIVQGSEQNGEDVKPSDSANGSVEIPALSVGGELGLGNVLAGRRLRSIIVLQFVLSVLFQPDHIYWV